MTARRTLAFVWDNLGPSHGDRLDVLGMAFDDRPVVAIEFARRSMIYSWDAAEGKYFVTHTLFGPDEPFGGWRLALRLIRAGWRLGRADIFYGHYEKWPLLVAAWVLRLRGSRAFAMIDSKFDDKTRRLLIEMVKPVFLSPYHGVLTASLRSRDYMRFLGFRADRIAMGFDTLSVDRIAALADSAPAPDGTPFAQRDFAIVARLVEKKNIAMAIDAYALWRRQSGGSRDLHICGSGPLEAELRAQAESAGIAGHVHFHGFVQSGDVARVLARALCLILPSVEEQYGLVVVEAQALGLPVLVSRNAGAADLLVEQGVNGFTLDPGNAASCAALMLMLSEDEALWRRFAQAARDRRERGDCRHFIAGVRELIGG